MFIVNIYLITTNKVSNTGGKYLHPKRIGTDYWYWKDDKGKIHKKNLNNVLYSPYSPVNI